MNLVPWRRRRERDGGLLTLRRELNQLFEDFFGDDWGLPALRTEEWAPAVDVSETEDAITVKAEIPGVNQDDIEISLTGDVLTIKGKKEEEKEEKGRSFHRIERCYGSFSRSFTLPSTVDQDNVKASYNKGVLEITLPKKAEAKAKTIKVNVK